MIFLHIALQVCALAYVSSGTNGHVLFAVDVEDFRNLASQYLSEALADKLSNMVASNRRESDSSNIDLDTLAKLIKDKLLGAYLEKQETTEMTTSSNTVKRFSTVKNPIDDQRLSSDPHGNKPILRYTDEETTTGPVYTRDDIENLLKNGNVENISDDKHKTYDNSEIRLNNSDEYVHSKETNKLKYSVEMITKNNKANKSAVNNKIDYTDTKLGDWLYNQVTSEKPVTIKNHKSPNMDIAKYDGDYDQSNKGENIRNTQYIYETRLSGTKDRRHPFENDNANIPPMKPKYKNKNNMSPKQTFDYIKKHQTPSTDNKYSSSQFTNEKIHESNPDYKDVPKYENIGPNSEQTIKEIHPDSIKALQEKNLASSETKNQEIEEHIHYDKYMLDSKEKYNFEINPMREFDDENIKYYQKKFEYEGNNRNSQFDIKHVPENEEQIIRKTKKKISDESVKNEFDEYNNPRELLLRNKKAKKAKERPASNGNGFKDLGDHPPDSKEDSLTITSDHLKEKKKTSIKLSSTEDEVKDTQLKHVMPTKENHLNERKQKKKSLEEIDIHEKGFHTKNLDKLKEDHTPVLKKPALENNILSHDDVDTEHHNNYGHIETTLLKSTIRGKHLKKGEVPKKVPSKEKYFQGVKQDAPAPASLVTKNRNKQTNVNGKDTNKKKALKEPIEENDMYEKFALGAGDKSNDEEFKKDHRGFEETFLGDSKSNIGRNKDENQSDNNDDLFLKNKNRQLKFTQKIKQFKNKELEVTKDDNIGFEETFLGDSRSKIGQNTDEDQPDNNDELLIKNKNRQLQFTQKINQFKKKEVEVKKDDNFAFEETFLGDSTPNIGRHKDEDHLDHNDELLIKNKNRQLQFTKKNKQIKKKEVEVKKDDNIAFEETFLGDSRPNIGRHKDELYSDNNDDLLIKNKNRQLQFTQKIKQFKKKEVEVKKDDNIAFEETFLGDSTPNIGRHKDEDHNDELLIKNKNRQLQFTKKIKQIKKKEEAVKNDVNIGFEETFLGHRRPKSVRNKDNDHSDNNDELLLKNMNRQLKFTKKIIEFKKKEGEFKKDDNRAFEATFLGDPSPNIGRDKNEDDSSESKFTKKIKKFKKMAAQPEGFADDPRPDFKEVKPESIKAKTEKLVDSVEEKDNGKATKVFKMKGTNIPKREFYKLSTHNYYNDLPRVVDKYDFEEPIPEKDRGRDKVAYLKREPARVNKKLKLPEFEKVRYL